MKRLIFFTVVLIIFLMVSFTDVSAFTFSATNFNGYLGYDANGINDLLLDSRINNASTGQTFNTTAGLNFDFTYVGGYPNIEDIMSQPMKEWNWTFGLTDITLPWDNTPLPDISFTHTASYNDILGGIHTAEMWWNENVPLDVCYAFDYNFNTPTTGTASFVLGTNIDRCWMPEYFPEQYYGEFCSDAKFTVSVDAEPIPEPVSMILFGAGLAGVGVVRRFRKKEK